VLISKEKVKRRRGEAYDINKQTTFIYNDKIKNRIKGALYPGAHTRQWREMIGLFGAWNRLLTELKLLLFVSN